ncbi:MAG TPA: GntR family transcriptional regulator [Candidatus Brocadiia bacterium]|nr:GntR family transcriptional regulator [Candidatus Brocadiia bacterium]
MGVSGETSVKQRAGVKHTTVTDALRQGILSGAYPVGSKLPSVADLSRTYGISPATAHRSIRSLAEERLVVCHSSPRGTVVARRETPERTFKRTTLACLLRPFKPQRSSVDNFGLEIIQGIQEEAARRRYRLLLQSLSDERHAEEMLELAREGWVAGAILDQYTPLELMRKLSELRTPMVIFNRWEHVEGLSCVTPDYERLGRQMARLMTQRGYERFAFFPARAGGELWPEYDVPQRDRYLGFMAGLEEEGIGQDRVERITFPEDVGETECDPERLGLPRRRPDDWRRLGVFLRSDRHVRQMLSAIAKTDLRLGNDVGVAGFGDLEVNRLSERPISTWEADPRGMGRETVAEAVRRIEDPLAPRAIIKLAVTYVDRGTV